MRLGYRVAQLMDDCEFCYETQSDEDMVARLMDLDPWIALWDTFDVECKVSDFRQHYEAGKAGPY